MDTPGRIKDNIKELTQAKTEKMRKLKEGIAETMERRRKQREEQRRPA